MGVSGLFPSILTGIVPGLAAKKVSEAGREVKGATQSAEESRNVAKEQRRIAEEERVRRQRLSQVDPMLQQQFTLGRKTLLGQ